MANCIWRGVGEVEGFASLKAAAAAALAQVKVMRKLEAQFLQLHLVQPVMAVRRR